MSLAHRMRRGFGLSTIDELAADFLKHIEANYSPGYIGQTRTVMNNRWREVPLHPRLAHGLIATEKISEWCFPQLKDTIGGKRGEKRSDKTRWFLEQVKYTAQRIGLPKDAVTFHGLRKTFATLVQESCGDLWLVGQLLGHTAQANSITGLYTQAEWVRKETAVLGVEIDRLRPMRL